MLKSTLQRWLPFHTFERGANLFLLSVVINGIIFSAWQLFFNFFVLGLGYDKAFLGIVNSLPSVAALIFGIPLGFLSDKIGRKQAMLLGLLVYTVAAGLQVTFPTRNMLVAMSMILGLGSTLFFISQSPFLMKVSTKENRALLFSLNFGLMTLSGAVGNLFAGQLPALFANLLHVAPRSAAAYQAVLIASVLLGSAALIPLFLIHEPANPPKEPAPEEKTQGRSVTRMAILWVLPNTVTGIGAAILIPYINVFFRERFHIPDGPLGVLFSISSLLTGVGSIIGPYIALRLGSKIRTVLLTQSLSLVFLAILGASPFSWLAGVGFLMRGMLMNMAAPLYSAFGLERIPPHAQGRANSFYSVTWQVGWSVGPYISGLVQERYGFTPLFIATFLLYSISIMMTALFFYRLDRPALKASAMVEKAV